MPRAIKTDPTTTVGTDPTTTVDTEITRIERRTIAVRIVGTAPLISERWTKKAIEMMEAKQAKKASAKTARDPESEWREYLYTFDDGRIGMPAPAFKAAIIGGARMFDSKAVPMVTLKAAVSVIGEGPDQLVPIECGEPEMWRNAVRNATGVADLRYRPRIWPWAAELIIRFPSPLLTDQLICNLVDAGGLGGIGGWRPSAPKSLTGTYGTFQVADE